MIDSYHYYIRYLAIQRHFNSKGYNYNKYNGKVNASKESFLRRRDKGLFNKFRYKFKDLETFKDYLIANFVYNQGFSVYNSTSQESYDTYEKWKKVNNNLKDYYFKDLRFLSHINIKSQLISVHGQLPKVIQYFIQDKICFETLVLLDIYFKFLERNDSIQDDDQFIEYKTKIQKYKNFMVVDLVEFEKITLETIIK